MCVFMWCKCVYFWVARRLQNAACMGLFSSLLGKRPTDFRTEILLFREILLFPRDFDVSDSNRKIFIARWVSFPKDLKLKRGPYRLSFQAGAARRFQLVLL